MARLSMDILYMYMSCVRNAIFSPNWSYLLASIELYCEGSQHQHCQHQHCQKIYKNFARYKAQYHNHMEEP